MFCSFNIFRTFESPCWNLFNNLLTSLGWLKQIFWKHSNMYTFTKVKWTTDLINIILLTDHHTSIYFNMSWPHSPYSRILVSSSATGQVVIRRLLIKQLVQRIFTKKYLWHYFAEQVYQLQILYTYILLFRLPILTSGLTELKNFTLSHCLFYKYLNKLCCYKMKIINNNNLTY